LRYPARAPRRSPLPPDTPDHLCLCGRPASSVVQEGKKRGEKKRKGGEHEAQPMIWGIAAMVIRAARSPDIRKRKKEEEEKGGRKENGAYQGLKRRLARNRLVAHPTRPGMGEKGKKKKKRGGKGNETEGSSRPARFGYPSNYSIAASAELSMLLAGKNGRKEGRERRKKEGGGTGGY